MNQGEYESENELGNCKCIFNNFPCTKCNTIYSKKNKKVCTECNVDLDDNCNEFNSLCKECKDLYDSELEKRYNSIEELKKDSLVNLHRRYWVFVMIPIIQVVE